MATTDPARTALMLVDMQNDFLHTSGAYDRANQKSDAIDALQPADLSVEKVAFSAFYQTRLDWVLRRAGIETLVFGGIVTNGGVASTLRDAHVRDFHNIVLSDGCAAFSTAAHDASIASLATIAQVATCDDISAGLPPV